MPDAALMERLLRGAMVSHGASLDGAVLHWRVPGGALGISACYAVMRRVLGETLPAATVVGGGEMVSLDIG